MSFSKQRVKTNEAAAAPKKEEKLEFEDQFEDVFEEEDRFQAKDGDWEDCDEENAEMETIPEETKGEEAQPEQKPYLGEEKLAEGEEMVFENSAYEMIHRANCEWPSLSIDFMLPERLDTTKVDEWFPNHVNKLDPAKTVKQKYNYGHTEVEVDRHAEDEYPYNCLTVAGSQALKRTENKLYVMKWSYLNKTLDEDDDGQIREDADESVIYYEGVPHKGGVNRVRTMNNSSICATWSDEGEVQIYNLQ